MCTTGAASSMWPIRSRRTFERVTSTPQRSQMMPSEADPLVLAAVALPVLGGTEDLLAEEAVLLRAQSPVVDGLRLLDLTVGPCADGVRGGQADAHLLEIVYVQHLETPLAGPSRIFLVGTPLRPAYVDAELLGGAEHVLVQLAHLDLLAGVGEDLDVEQRLCISLISTLKLSGMPGSGMFSPLTMAS